LQAIQEYPEVASCYNNRAQVYQLLNKSDLALGKHLLELHMRECFLLFIINFSGFGESNFTKRWNWKSISQCFLSKRNALQKGTLTPTLYFRSRMLYKVELIFKTGSILNCQYPMAFNLSFLLIYTFFSPGMNF